MLLAIAAALGTSLAYGVSNFMAGVAARGTALAGLVLGSQLAALVLGLPFPLLAGEALPTGSSLVASLLAGVGQAVALGAFYRALSLGAVSIVAPIGAVGVVLPVLAGLASGDAVAALQVLGMALCVVGIAVAARRRSADRAETAAAPMRSVALALVASTSFGLQYIAFAEASSAGIFWPITLARAASVVAVLATVAIARPQLAVARSALGVVVLVGVLNHLASGLFVFASALGGALSVVSVLASLNPAITVLLALAVLGERLSALQGAGVAAALTGVVLIAAG